MLASGEDEARATIDAIQGRANRREPQERGRRLRRARRVTRRAGRLPLGRSARRTTGTSTVVGLDGRRPRRVAGPRTVDEPVRGRAPARVNRQRASRPSGSNSSSDAEPRAVADLDREVGGQRPRPTSGRRPSAVGPPAREDAAVGQDDQAFAVLEPDVEVGREPAEEPLARLEPAPATVGPHSGGQRAAAVVASRSVVGVNDVPSSTVRGRDA